MNPPSIVWGGGGVHGKVCWLIAYSDMFSIIMYADHTTLFCNFDNVCSENKINSELDNVFDWCK